MIRAEISPHTPVLLPVQPLVAFAHLADTQMVDEESPGRVELVDFIGGDPFSASYRPQEGLMPFVLNEEARAVRNLRRGPATGAPIRLVMTGGDNVDNAQYNETRWFIDIMDGGRIVNPNSGRPARAGSGRRRSTAGCAAAAASTSRTDEATARGTPHPWRRTAVPSAARSPRATTAASTSR